MIYPVVKAKRFISGIRSWFERNHAKTFQQIRNILLEMYSAKRSPLIFDSTALTSPKEILLTFEKEESTINKFCEIDTLLRVFCAKKFIFMDDDIDVSTKTAFFYILRNSKIKKQIFLLLAALRDKVDLYFVETGFVSRITNVQDAAVPLAHRRSCSWIVDDMALYYDALVPSRIEQYLNSETRRLTPAECERARKIMTLLREYKITKYNYQPIYTPDALQLPGKKVLVADQSLRDASITRGMANEKSFAAMLDAAVSENPDAHVIIKLHPDSISKGRGSYYGKVKESGRIYKLTEVVNPWCVLEAVDKVYVCTSQIGLEALMCGNEVHCFGMPVYAGWGLTKDRVTLERRRAHVSLEEFVHALYVKFAVYVHPEREQICDVECIIGYLRALIYQ
jgi:capsular polysaccharide export protein